MCNTSSCREKHFSLLQTCWIGDRHKQLFHVTIQNKRVIDTTPTKVIYLQMLVLVKKMKYASTTQIHVFLFGWYSFRLTFLKYTHTHTVYTLGHCTQKASRVFVLTLLPRQDVCEGVSKWYVHGKTGGRWRRCWILFTLWSHLCHLHRSIAKRLLNLFSGIPATPGSLCHSLSIWVNTVVDSVNMRLIGMA